MAYKPLAYARSAGATAALTATMITMSSAGFPNSARAGNAPYGFPSPVFGDEESSLSRSDCLEDFEEAPHCSLDALIEGKTVKCKTAKEKFKLLSKVWKQFNDGRSVTEYNHAAYMQVIGMGIDIMPLLLQQLEEGDGDWIVAMKYIVGASATTPAMRGDFSAIKEAWLNWGRDNGFGH